jgi:hypothetical protein
MFEWVRDGILEIPHEVLTLDAIGEAWSRQTDGPGLKLVVDPNA